MSDIINKEKEINICISIYGIFLYYEIRGKWNYFQFSNDIL